MKINYKDSDTLLWLLTSVMIVILVIFFTTYYFISNGLYTAKNAVKKTNGNLTTNTTPSQTPTPLSTVDETADWKTYVNEEYGFEFKYPSDFVLLDITSEQTWNSEADSLTPLNKISAFSESRFIAAILPNEYATPITPKKGPGEFYIKGLRIEIIEKPFPDVLEDVRSSEYFRYDDDYNIEEYNVNGTNVTVLSRYNSRLQSDTTTAIIPNDSYTYILSNDLPGVGHGSEYFDQILSTFEFLDN